MQGLNRIFLLGYLGQDPKTYSTKNGQQYTGLSIATHRYSAAPRDEEDGEEAKEKTDWHYVHVWGKQAENCAKYLSKGQGVMVEGYLTQYRKESEDGEIQSKVSINALHVTFLPRARGLSLAN